MPLPKTKILDMEDLKHPDFKKVNSMFDSFFGLNWPEVPLRRWEYVAAIVFSDVMKKPGLCLDAGCGSNVFAKFLEKIDCEICCIDIGQKNMIEGKIQHYNMSMVDLKFYDNWFDYVFAISSIEHVNAGRFKIDGLPFDTGDAQAMKELVRVLKPGGKLILTTDYADRYYPPPGLWPSGSHRIYNKGAISTRLLSPCDNLVFIGDGRDLEFDWSKLKEVEPIGYNYTEMIMTLGKC